MRDNRGIEQPAVTQGTDQAREQFRVGCSASTRQQPRHGVARAAPVDFELRVRFVRGSQVGIEIERLPERGFGAIQTFFRAGVEVFRHAGA
jgi:hypothetical protein